MKYLFYISLILMTACSPRFDESAMLQQLQGCRSSLIEIAPRIWQTRNDEKLAVIDLRKMAENADNLDAAVTPEPFKAEVSLPLAKKLKSCGILRVSPNRYLGGVLFITEFSGELLTGSTQGFLVKFNDEGQELVVPSIAKAIKKNLDEGTIKFILIQPIDQDISLYYMLN